MSSRTPEMRHNDCFIANTASTLEQIKDQLFNFDQSEIEYDILCKQLCGELLKIGNSGLKCNSHLYSGIKQDEYYGYTEETIQRFDSSNKNSVEKAFFLLKNLPDFSFLYNEMIQVIINSESSELEHRNYQRLQSLFDEPMFINSLYSYLWAILYSYAIKTFTMGSFIILFLRMINTRIRPDYIIQSCKNISDTDIVTSDYNNDIKINLNKYVCGRALGKILEPNKKTRLVLYNTISSTNDFMDEEYFESIKHTLSGGKSKKKKSKGTKKYKR